MTAGGPPDYQEALDAAADGSPFSNSTEGEYWMEANCYRCAHDAAFQAGLSPEGCPLLLIAMTGKTPAQWERGDPGDPAMRYSCAHFRPAES